MSTNFSLLIDMRDVNPLPNEPLIDEPVTGSGNDDMWIAVDDRPSADSTPPN